MSTLELGIIGNCQTSALIDQHARIVWSCFPDFDGDPVFCSLLHGKDEPASGFFDVVLDGLVGSEQRYLPNTPILETILRDSAGGAVKITDFCPRFQQYDRSFRPTTIVRYVEPLAGNPRVTVRLRPAGNYGAEAPSRTHGSNHIRYVGSHITLRLSTDASLRLVQYVYPFLSLSLSLSLLVLHQ